MLVLLSVLFYFIHYLIFKDIHHIFLYLIGDIGFLFLDVLIVMLVLHRLLEYREKRAVLKKLNMVIGVFFSEVGTELMRIFTRFDNDLSSIEKDLIVNENWTARKFLEAKKKVGHSQSTINIKEFDMAKLRNFLSEKRQFLLNLLENPNLLEHESFTDLLLPVFHLTDELSHRKDLTSLPDPDLKHLAGDIKRVYKKLILEWLDYMQYLKDAYPYLFSLAIRTNPFDTSVKVEIS